MWVEAILSKEDLAQLVTQFAPVKIRLGEDGSISVSEPGDITVVPDVGLRVVCKAKLTWPVLGIPLPITLRTVTVILHPKVVKRASGDTLVFTLEIEHADLAGVPTLIDKKITEKVNKALSEENVELAWNFTKALSHVFKLPASLDPHEAFALGVAWGQVKVTSDAMVLAVSFHANVTKRAIGDPPPEEGQAR